MTVEESANLPIAVRRARPDDRESVLAFASATWDGWDYVPEAWPHWIAAPDGVFLVATAQGDDRPIAITRLALLAADEGWLEGIRVDPAVRGRGVATNLQVAQLAWARAHGLGVLRYATGRGNEASLKLGAHHGFVRVADRRTWSRPEDEGEPGAAPPPMDPTVEAARRRDLLAALATDGVAIATDAPESSIAAAWRVVDTDATFEAGGRLYEHRSWSLQRLTHERFAAHVRRGEVLVTPGARAVAILPHVAHFSEDLGPHLAVVAGDGHAALELLLTVERLAGSWVSVRLADPSPALLADPAVASAWSDAGIRPHDWSLHIMERPLPGDEPLPLAEPPGALELRDSPRRIAAPPEIGD